MNKQHDNLSVTSALMAGVVGITGAYLLYRAAPSISREKREAICSCCHKRASDCNCSQASSLNPFYLGALCTAIGASTALLLAPKSGKELREEISEVIDQVSSKTQEIAGNIEKEGEELYEGVVNGSSELFHKAKNMAKKLTNTAQEEVSEPLTNKIEDALHVVQMGIKFWNTLSRR